MSSFSSNLRKLLYLILAEKETPTASALFEAPQVNDLKESRPAASESPATGESPKEPELIMPPEDDDLRQEDTVRSETALQEQEVPVPAEPPEPTDPPAPIEAPTESQPKSAYDYPFDISVIHSDCIAIGKSMGYMLNTSLTP